MRVYRLEKPIYDYYEPLASDCILKLSRQLQWRKAIFASQALISHLKIKLRIFAGMWMCVCTVMFFYASLS
jgi:hypothetical protein